MLVDILMLVHFVLVAAILIGLMIGSIKDRISKPSALLFGTFAIILAILPQLIIKMTGAWQKIEYYFVYGVALVILLVIGMIVRKRYREITNENT